MGDRTRVTAALRRVWLAGVVLFLVGVLVPGTGGMLGLPGFLVVAMAAGATAARGLGVGPVWSTLAWAVPVLPPATGVGVFAWLAHENADPLAVALLVFIGVPLVLGTWAAFVLALLVELVRLHLRRRRFGSPTPAWENAPTPPSYS